jgi:hypothetical protein
MRLVLTARTIILAAVAVVTMTTAVQAAPHGPWSRAATIESIPGASASLNSPALEGCPFVAQRDDILYFASNRGGGAGGIDIWYSVRRADGSWGAPVNFVEVNTSANELCPMAHRNGRTFLFVSSRPGGCGGDDLYATRLHATRGWASPNNLGCTVNSAANEASPSLTETELYFSSTRGGLSDIYVSPFDGEAFGAPSAIGALNTAANDSRPNLRRDGLEIFFDSDRAGGSGAIDLWTSTRATTSDAWSAPVNLGGSVNSTANDLRPSLSWDGASLYFGSTRSGGEGVQDLYVTTR